MKAEDRIIWKEVGRGDIDDCEGVNGHHAGEGGETMNNNDSVVALGVYDRHFRGFMQLIIVNHQGLSRDGAANR